MTESEARPRTHAVPARVVVLLLGLVYLVLAVAGTATVGWDQFGWEEPVRLFGVLGTSTLLNLVHGFVGFVGLVALLAALLGAAFAFAPVLGVAFTAMAAFGTVSRVFADAGDPLNLTWWNVVLYALSVAACGYTYLSRAPVVRTKR